MRRREWIGVSLALAAACSKRPAFPIEEVDIATLAKGLGDRRFSSQDLVRAYLQRIDAIDRRGPKLSSVIETNPDALAIAAALDKDSSASRGPLYGIPILIKDNIDTADNMKTTAGSLALETAPAPRQDAPIVAKLRAAGAVILGKTNLSEWANIRSSRSTSGWSARGGLTRNPYVLDRNTSGSSSGSGAAAAASLCAAALGTETDGSIVSPASINGLVGIKPTVGLLSGEGIIPIAKSQDTAGPMARTVHDAVLLLSAMNERGTDYTPFLELSGLEGARLGVARQFMGPNPEVERLMREAITLMKNHRAEIIDPIEITPTSEYSEAEIDLLLFELKAGLNAYLAGRGSDVKTLKDVIAFNERNTTREMPWFGQELFIRAEQKEGLDSAAYAAVRKTCAKAAAGIEAAMEKHKLDAIIAPTDGPAWITDFVNADHFTQSCSTPPAVAGYPHITVPCGQVHGLPVGLSFFGRANSEERLIRLAYAYEQLSKARRPPTYLDTIRQIV